MAKKTGNVQMPEIVQIADEQVHHLCSYIHCYVKNDNSNDKMGQNHNNIYDTDELTHEYEYDIYEDVMKTEQLMADIKRIDDKEKAAVEKFNEVFNNFPLLEFKHAGQINNPADPGLRKAAKSELYVLEQLALQQLQNDNNNTVDRVSHVQQSEQHEDQPAHFEHNSHVHMVHCPVYVLYNDEKQKILVPLTMDMSRKDNAKPLYDDSVNTEWDSNSYVNEKCHDTEMFSYMHYDSSKQIMVQAVYIGNYSPVSADIKGESYSMITYDEDSNLEGIYDNTYTIPMYVDNGSTVNLLPTWYYEQATFLHHLPQHDASGETIKTGNGSIQCRFWTDIALNVQGCLLQLKILMCDTQAQTGIVISKMALEQLQTWQDYASNTMYINHSLHLDFGFLSLSLDHGSGKVVVNLDSHSFLQYLLCLYPNHVIYTSFDVKTLVHLLNQTLARKL